MPELSPEATAATKVFDYAHSGGDSASSDAFRQEVTNLLKVGNDTSGFNEDLGQRLVDNGTLPDLLVKDWGKIDVDSDGKASYLEILNAATQTEDPLLRILGQAVNDNKIEGSINPQTWYPEISYETAKKAAFETPEQRPSDSAVLPVDVPAAVVPPNGDIPAGTTQPPLTVEGTAALADLQNPAITAEAKLKAITTLVQQGQTTATIRDADGTPITVRLEMSPISAGNSKNFVHMFAVDPATGKETVMMRAISDGTNFLKQRDANGEEIGFVGSKWMKNHPTSMFKA